MLGAALLFASSAAAETPYAVRQNWSCSLDEARAIVQATQIGKAQMRAALVRFSVPLADTLDEAGCSFWPRMMGFQIKEVLESYYDWDGDVFYLVRIGFEDKRTYTFAWPGFNTDLPAPDMPQEQSL